MSEILGHNLAWTGRGGVMWEVGMGLGLQREPLLWSLPPCHLPRLGILQPASPPAPRLPSIRLIVQKAEVQRLTLWVSGHVSEYGKGIKSP